MTRNNLWVIKVIWLTIMLRLLQCGASTLVLAQTIPSTGIPGIEMIKAPSYNTWQEYYDYAKSLGGRLATFNVAM